MRRAPEAAPSGFAPAAEESDRLAAITRNVTRVTAMKKALAMRSDSDIDRLIAVSEKEVVGGVNICAPVDFKPEHSDRYCIRCEGFAECSARHLRLNRPSTATNGEDLATAP